MTNSEPAASAAATAPSPVIPFLRPLVTGDESAAIAQAIAGGKLCGDGPFSRRVEDWFRAHLGCARALMVPSGTQALEMAALLLDIQPGDEVIMPSFTFVSTANAFGGGQCIRDLNIVVVGNSVTLPMSKICPSLEIIGNIMVAVSLLLAARILTRG